VAEAERADPLVRAASRLAASGVPAEELAEIASRAREEMVTALRVASETPFPETEEAYRDVQDVGSGSPTHPAWAY
ncbi:MAG: hypothetical protein JWN32_115, partial [Solirubrobacterales bacterium]|nr:hypothetical protein [Solirubrobacterales bacterium]